MFRVKDADAFIKLVSETPDLGLWDETITRDETEERVFGIYSDNADGGGWPSMIYNEETQDYDDFDLSGAIAPHLHDDDVCVLMEVGYEKLRYLVGIAIAVNAKGEERVINLDDIYTKAVEELGADKTRVAQS
jgi:hypothetical protein